MDGGRAAWSRPCRSVRATFLSVSEARQARPTSAETAVRLKAKNCPIRVRGSPRRPTSLTHSGNCARDPGVAAVDSTGGSADEQVREMMRRNRHRSGGAGADQHAPASLRGPVHTPVSSATLRPGGDARRQAMRGVRSERGAAAVEAASADPSTHARALRDHRDVAVHARRGLGVELRPRRHPDGVGGRGAGRARATLAPPAPCTPPSPRLPWPRWPPTPSSRRARRCPGPDQLDPGLQRQHGRDTRCRRATRRPPARRTASSTCGTRRKNQFTYCERLVDLVLDQRLHQRPRPDVGRQSS